MKRTENKPIRFIFNTAEGGKGDFSTIFQEFLTCLVIFGRDCLHTEKKNLKGGHRKGKSRIKPQVLRHFLRSFLLWKLYQIAKWSSSTSATLKMNSPLEKISWCFTLNQNKFFGGKFLIRLQYWNSCTCWWFSMWFSGHLRLTIELKVFYSKYGYVQCVSL